jgi:hypothetical protein
MTSMSVVDLIASDPCSTSSALNARVSFRWSIGPPVVEANTSRGSTQAEPTSACSTRCHSRCCSRGAQPGTDRAPRAGRACRRVQAAADQAVARDAGQLRPVQLEAYAAADHPERSAPAPTDPVGVSTTGVSSPVGVDKRPPVVGQLRRSDDVRWRPSTKHRRSSVVHPSSSPGGLHAKPERRNHTGTRQARPRARNDSRGPLTKRALAFSLRSSASPASARKPSSR